MNSDDAHWDIHGYYITHPRLITWIKQIANRGERQHGAPHHGWRVSLNKKAPRIDHDYLCGYGGWRRVED